MISRLFWNCTSIRGVFKEDEDRLIYLESSRHKASGIPNIALYIPNKLNLSESCKHWNRNESINQFLVPYYIVFKDWYTAILLQVGESGAIDAGAKPDFIVQSEGSLSRHRKLPELWIFKV